MLIHYKPLLLLLLSTLLTLPNCQPPTQISQTLPCPQQSKLYSLPIQAGTTYLISMQVKIGDGLPLVLSVFGTMAEADRFDAGDLYGNKGVDFQAVEMGKRGQRLYYMADGGSNWFVVGVFRLNLGKLSYPANTDRQIQSYTGNNPSQLIICTTPIPYTLTIQPLTLSLPLLPPNMPVPPPQTTSQCLFGTFNPQTRQCHCFQNYGMPLCDAYFSKIGELDRAVRRYEGLGGRAYYYFQPGEGLYDGKMFVTVQVNVKGSVTGKFVYNDQNPHPPFSILLSIQPTTTPLSIPSYFTQLNPSTLSTLTLKKGQKLLLTVYKPLWSTPQSYQLSLSLPDSILSQVITIVIAVCAAVTVLVVAVFVGYVVYNRRRARLLLGLGLADVVGVGRGYGVGGVGKVVNFYFDVEEYFPTVKYSELETTIAQACPQQTPQSPDRGCCAICLQPFQQPSLVKSTYCLHIFHAKCLAQWMQRSPSCPLCRKEYNPAIIDRQDRLLGIYRVRLTALEKYAKLWGKNGGERGMGKENGIGSAEIQSSHNINPCPEQMPN